MHTQKLDDPLPDPTDDDLRAIESEPVADMSDLDDELSRALDARRSAIPLKAKKRDRPTFGIQKLDSLYKDPSNWEAWSNVTLIHKAEVDTILGWFVSYKHRTVLGARKLVRGHDPLLGQETEIVSDPWYLHNSEERYRSEPSSTIHFVSMLHIILDDGLASEGEHPVSVSALRGVGISRVCLDKAVRLSGPRTILYLPAGLDILDGLARECKIKLKESFDAQS